MMQAYPLSVAYLALSSLIYFSLAGPGTFKAVRDFRLYLSASPFRSRLYLCFGIVLSLLCLIFPIQPGPPFLGDLAVAAALFFSSFALMDGEKEDKRDKDGIDRGGRDAGGWRARAWTMAAVAILHLVFPTFVII